MKPTNQRWTWPAGFETLMRESETLIHYVSDAGSESLKAITKPIIEDSGEYLLWERQHSCFMRLVAKGQSRPVQLFRLRQIIMTIVHRTALVDLIRQQRIDDEVRNVLVSHFHPSKNYGEAWLAELHDYRRIQSSSICARYFAIKLGDPLLRNWLEIYRQTYHEYFADYCRMVVAERSGTGDLKLWREAVAESKSHLTAKHQAILRSTNVLH